MSRDFLRDFDLVDSKVAPEYVSTTRKCRKWQPPRACLKVLCVEEPGGLVRIGKSQTRLSH